MNLNDPRHPWSRLTAAARLAQDTRDTTPPYGFATRIAALAAIPEARLSYWFERFALRAVAVSSLLALGSVLWNLSAVRPVPTPASVTQSVEEEAIVADDALAAVLESTD